MRIAFALFLTLLPAVLFPQGGTTFQIEELARPGAPLPTVSPNEIYRNLIRSDGRMPPSEEAVDLSGPPYGIVAKSALPPQLVTFGYHPFFNGMYQAYADHRPFVLSPDMIWLLVSQGFACHVNSDPEKYRSLFVVHEGKLTLEVRNDSIRLDDPESPWETVFPEFTRQIASLAGAELVDVLTCDFSTTTPVSRVASQITVMEATKAYFDFVSLYVVCGIPEITLEGTPNDWRKVAAKANALRRYDLDWWIDRIEPLLNEFVHASEGDVDKPFWREMFKYHTEQKYGNPQLIDGWIVRFFPYDRDGKRTDPYGLRSGNRLPDEIVKVDLAYVRTDGVRPEAIPLELWAGFVGLEQTPGTFALKPQIGWMIRRKILNGELIDLFRMQNERTKNTDKGIRINAREIPAELLELDSIRCLDIYFTNGLRIPDRISRVAIGELVIRGCNITPQEKERIHELLPNTKLVIPWSNVTIGDAK